MKFYIPLFASLLPTLLVANIDGISDKLSKEFDKKIATVGAQSSHGPKEMMIIEPMQRAKDFKAAFDILSSQHTKERVTFSLTDKSVLSGILDVSVLPGGTMLSFRLNTTRGVKTRVIPIEQIDSVSH